MKMKLVIPCQSADPFESKTSYVTGLEKTAFSPVKSMADWAHDCSTKADGRFFRITLIGTYVGSDCDVML